MDGQKKSRRPEEKPAVIREHPVYEALRRGIGKGKNFAFHLNLEEGLAEHGGRPPVQVHFRYEIMHSPSRKEAGSHTIQLENALKGKKLLNAIHHDAQALSPVGVRAHLNPDSTILGITMRKFTERRKNWKQRRIRDSISLQIQKAIEQLRKHRG